MSYKSYKTHKARNQKAQLLLELLVAISIFAIVALVFVKTIGTALWSNKYSRDYSTALGLLSGLQERARSLSSSDWHSIYNVTKGPCADTSCHYKIVESTSSQWEIQQGEETVTLNGINYTRYIVVYNVERDGSGNIVDSGGTIDPLTQKIVSYISWSGKTKEISEYVSRSYEEANTQTDWSGGAVGDEVTSQVTTTFSTSSYIDYNSTSGEIELKRTE